VTDRVVIVGASMGGLRAGEALRKAGFTGEVLVIGAEDHMPYNRPPLSKDALYGSPDLQSLLFRIPRAAADITWRLGQRVTSADLDRRTVTLTNGQTLGWDGLVIASGLAPRTLQIPGPSGRRHVIRTVDDARSLRSELIPGARLVVVGAGFIGCEVAATARKLGVEVDVVGSGLVPMQRPLGLDLGAELQRRHEARGVRFHFRVVPTEYLGAADVTAVQLSDGAVLHADLVVEAIGCEPELAWLEGNGLDLSDGLLCDNQLRVVGRADVVACGDVARFPNPRFDQIARRVEHWTMVTDTARRAGHTLGSHLSGGTVDTAAFAPIPSFWSDQYDLRLQSFGAVTLGADDVRILEGDLGEEVAVGYHRDDELVGVVLIGLGGRHVHYRSLIEAI
jgi:3-phenylpropionate/trans-cinnamate dioxygenase ferredoxin reductase subunit